jgi:hypothetical protein
MTRYGIHDFLAYVWPEKMTGAAEIEAIKGMERLSQEEGLILLRFFTL